MDDTFYRTVIKSSKFYNLKDDPWKGEKWVQKPKVEKRPFIKFCRPQQAAPKTSWKSAQKAFRRQMRLHKRQQMKYHYPAAWKLQETLFVLRHENRGFIPRHQAPMQPG